MQIKNVCCRYYPRNGNKKRPPRRTAVKGRGITLDEDQYFTERLDDQIDWYDAKSQSCQKWYKRLKGTICFLAILVAPISLLEWGYCRYILSIFGVIIAALNFMLSLNKYHENWIQYRMTCELLRHERYLYLTRAGEYGQSDAPFQNLVMRCESIISSENIDWAQLHRNEPSLPSASQSSTNS